MRTRPEVVKVGGPPPAKRVALTTAATSVRFFLPSRGGILNVTVTRIPGRFKGSALAQIIEFLPLAQRREEAMSVGEWKPIPPGLLKMRMTPGGFGRLKYEVQVLVSHLAEEQGYKCALCSQNHSLEIEHDHDPEYGTGDVPTIYNIRGLACRGCNWHIMMYERNNNGEYISFGEASSRLSDHDWEKYIYPYQCRVSDLNEERLQKELGILNYWRRRNLLNKFDEWREYGGRYPWYWGFDEIKDQKYGKVKTPRQFIKGVSAILQYVKGEFEKDPDYQPPEMFFDFLVRLKPLLDDLRPIVEARMLELGKAKNAAVGALA